MSLIRFCCISKEPYFLNFGIPMYPFYEKLPPFFFLKGKIAYFSYQNDTDKLLNIKNST